jgi:hypothetical protein
MVESSRKHGHFDGRYPALPRSAAQTWVPARDGTDGDRLDWSAFLGRFFPNRRRHDRAALAAYEAYLKWVVRASASDVPETGSGPRTKQELRMEGSAGW